MFGSGCRFDTRNNSSVLLLLRSDVLAAHKAGCRMLSEPQRREDGGKPASDSQPRGNAHPPLGWELLGSEGHCCHLVSLSPAWQESGLRGVQPLEERGRTVSFWRSVANIRVASCSELPIHFPPFASGCSSPALRIRGVWG